MSRLLKYLDVPERTVENELVAERLALDLEGSESDRLAQRMAALRVKAVVLAAINSLDAAERSTSSRGARQRAIITRCDLRHEKHHAVAADLGISLREFYRERRRAFSHLVARLRAELYEVREPATTLPSRFELELDHVANLKLAGDVPGAFKVLEATARSTTSSRERVRAWCLGVELATDYGDDERSRRFLDEALRAAESIDENDAPSTFQVELEMAVAAQSWSAGDIRRTLASSKRAAHAASRLPSADDRWSARVACTAFLHAGVIGLFTNDPAEALRLLGDARRILDRMRHKPPDMLGCVLMAFGAAQRYLDGQAARSLEYLSEACAVLHNAGENALLSIALRELGETLLMIGDLKRATAVSQSALMLAEATGSANGSAYAYLSLAGIEVAGGHPMGALKFAARAREMHAGGLAEAGIALVSAEASVALRRYKTALKLAESVHGVVDAPGPLLGRALRIEAEAYEGLGDRRAAQKRIEAAVDVLAKHGQQRAKQRAFASSARITGKLEHNSIAKEMAVVLQPPQAQNFGPLDGFPMEAGPVGEP